MEEKARNCKLQYLLLDFRATKRIGTYFHMDGCALRTRKPVEVFDGCKAKIQKSSLQHFTDVTREAAIRKMSSPATKHAVKLSTLHKQNMWPLITTTPNRSTYTTSSFNTNLERTFQRGKNSVSKASTTWPSNANFDAQKCPKNFNQSVGIDAEAGT